MQIASLGGLAVIVAQLSRGLSTLALDSALFLLRDHIILCVCMQIASLGGLAVIVAQPSEGLATITLESALFLLRNHTILCVCVCACRLPR